MSFENENNRKVHRGYYLSEVEIKYYNVWVMENVLLKKVKSNIRTYNNIWKIATGQRDEYTTGCLLYFNYLSKHFKMIEIDLS